MSQVTNIRKVTVFGCTGFLGRRVVQHLLDHGFAVRVASRHPERSAQVWDTYEHEFVAPFEALMADGSRSGDLRSDQATRTLVHAFLGLLEALTVPGGHLARSDAEHQATAAAVVSLFLDGAAAERARSVLSS